MEERRRPSRWWYALLALPFAGLLYPPLYARRQPGALRLPVLLLVPAGVGAGGRAADLDRLPRPAPLAPAMQKHDTDAVALIVFGLLFGFVTVLGFVAARWRRGDLGSLDEWGLGGRRFGTVVTWFLLGGDLYTAYTFIAVPALVFGVGAQGFFALPYTIIVYPLVFIAVPRLWVVAHRRGYVTPADFVRGRFGSRPLATAVAAHGPAGHDALHRAAARRPAGRPRRDGHQRRLAAGHRLRHPRRLHLPERPARAGADRGGQGRADLPDGPRRDHLHPVASSAASARSSTPPARPCRRRTRRGRSSPGRPTRRPPTRRSPSARRWRSSCTRTR